MKVINSTLTDREFLMVEIQIPDSDETLVIEATIDAGPKAYQIDRVTFAEKRSDSIEVYRAYTDEIELVLKREISRHTAPEC